MKELEKLKYEIDLVSKGEHNQEFTGIYQRFTELHQALQFHKTFGSGSFFDLIEDSLKREAQYFGAMSLKDAEKCQEYILKAEEYLNAIDWLRNCH